MCTIVFMRSITCLRFDPMAKVTREILKNTIPSRVKRGETWVMPSKYEIWTVAQWVLQDSFLK
jgi:hypothetical protein